MHQREELDVGRSVPLLILFEQLENLTCLQLVMHVSHRLPKAQVRFQSRHAFPLQNVVHGVDTFGRLIILDEGVVVLVKMQCGTHVVVTIAHEDDLLVELRSTVSIYHSAFAQVRFAHRALRLQWLGVFVDDHNRLEFSHRITFGSLHQREQMMGAQAFFHHEITRVAQNDNLVITGVDGAKEFVGAWT